MKTLKAQTQLSPEKFVDNVCKMARNGKNPDQQIALIDVVEILKDFVSYKYNSEERFDAVQKLSGTLADVLILNGLKFDQNNSTNKKFVSGKEVTERHISISFTLVGVYFVFGWATNLPGIQMVYQQREKIYFAIH